MGGHQVGAYARRSVRYALRSVRYALRSLISAWAFVIAIPIFVAAALEYWGMWIGDVQWALDIQGAAVGLVGALLCGTVAVDTARLHRVGARHLLVAARSQRRSFVFVWAAGALSAVIPFLLVCVLLTVRAASAALVWQDIAHGSAIIAVGVAILGALAALGSLIGRYLPVLLSGVAATLGGIVVLYANVTSGTDGLFPLFVGGGTIARLGTLFDVPRAALQVLLCVLIILVCIAAPVRFRREIPTPTAWSAVAICVLGALVTVPAVTIHLPKYVADPAPRWVCTTSAPPICALVQASARMAWYEQPTRILTQAAQGAPGYESLVPDAVIIDFPTRGSHSPVQAGTIAVAPFYDRPIPDHIVWLSTYASNLTMPLHCRSFRESDTMSDALYTQIRRLGATWASLTTADPTTKSYVLQGQPALPPAEVQGILGRFAACDLD